MPDDLLQKIYIREFGVKAVMGREVLSYGEIRRMGYVETIVQAYQSRELSTQEGGGGWVKWCGDHPAWVNMLDDAMAAVKESEQQHG